MKSFTDNTGRTWPLAVTVETIKRVRALCDVDLANIITIDSGTLPKVDLLEKLGSDPVLLVDVLFAAVKPEADAKGVTDEEFGRTMSVDAIEMATTALLDEVIDFFPETKRKVFRKILDATRRFETKGKAALQAFLDDPALDGKIDAALAQLMTSSGNSQGSQA